MRALAVISIALAVLLLDASTPAPAIEMRQLQGTYGAAQLKSACGGAGGKFSQTSAGHSCVKANCDGKGGDCAVDCDKKGKCSGTTPDRVAPTVKLSVGIAGLREILTNSPPTQPSPSGKKAPTAGILGGGPGMSSQVPSATGKSAAPSKGGIIY